MIVRIDHYSGFGGSYLARVVDYPRPGKGATNLALEYAAERQADRIGVIRGGDGYGYWDEDEFVAIDIHVESGAAWVIIGDDRDEYRLALATCRDIAELGRSNRVVLR